MNDDAFNDVSDTLVSPSRSPFTIVPSDDVPLPRLPKAIYVGTGGSIMLRGVDSGADVVFRNVASGQVLDVRPGYVRASGTTAADLVGLA